MNTWVNLALVIAAYFFGGFSSGYWLVRWRTGRDVRTHGSGGTGATNVGRILGRSGFIIVCLADVAKGAAMVGLARWLGASDVWTQVVVLAVIVGHVWPMQLGFRGGKGVGPLIGAWLVLDPIVLLPSLVVTLLALAFLRRFTRAGLCGLAVLPAAVWWFQHDRAIVMLAAATLLVVFYAHREHLRRWLHPDAAAS
jgi:glycerol-3-phosphate acyltransferase PlsY